MRQLLQYGIRLGQQQNSADLSPEDLLREATVRLFHVVFPYLLTDEWFVMVSGWSRSSKQSRDTNILPPHHRLEQERGGTTMHTITHCFFSQSRLYSSHLGHFVHATSPRHSVCLTTAHVCTHYAKKRNTTRYTIPPSTHALGLHILCYHTHFTIALTLMLSCNVSYAFFLFIFSPPRSQVSASGHFFPTQHTPHSSLPSLLISPVN